MKPYVVYFKLKNGMYIFPNYRFFESLVDIKTWIDTHQHHCDFNIYQLVDEQFD